MKWITWVLPSYTSHCHYCDWQKPTLTRNAGRRKVRRHEWAEHAQQRAAAIAEGIGLVHDDGWMG